MKQILFVINTMGYGGAERAMISLMKKLSPEEYKISLYVLLSQGELLSEVPSYVTVLNPEYSKESVLSQKGKKQLKKQVLCQMLSSGAVFRNTGYLIRNLAAMGKRGMLYPDKLLWRVMADGGMKNDTHYDLAVAYLEGGATYYVNRHIKADKKVAFIHVDYKKAGYTRALDRDCYLDFDQIFSVSDEVKQSFLSVYPECKSKTAVFHNIIDEQEIREKALLPGGFSDSYTGYRILTVGRLTGQKAYEVAIEAMKMIKDRGIEARWYVLGDGELKKELTGQIERLGLTDSFFLLGVKENPYPYYRQCDLYVHATRFEGKSIAIQEAKLLGCAILVSDTSGNREQITDGINGRMCALDAKSIADMAAELLLDEKERKRYSMQVQKEKLSEKEETDRNIRRLLDANKA